MLKYHKLNEMFTRALECMVTLPGNIKERLNYALIKLVSVNKEIERIISDKGESDEMAELLELWERFYKVCTWIHQDENEGKITATISRMSDVEAVDIANQFLSMYYIVAKLQ